MENPLTDMRKSRDFLVCVDSDGCVFDNMELKHKECFSPATVNVWDLQGVSRYAREAAEYVNLYSRWRGTNRFPALVRTLELLAERPEAIERGYRLPDLSPIREWIKRTKALSSAALSREIDRKPDCEVLRRAARWSDEVNANIARIVRGVPPFPHVKEALSAISRFADIVVVSATPHEAIVREWEEHGLTQFVTAIAGQELGGKKECIALAAKDRYRPENVLMVGDAPGDHDAANANGVAFYPIVPGYETQSWERLSGEEADIFKAGRYVGARMNARVAEFYEVLLDTPPWLCEPGRP